MDRPQTIADLERLRECADIGEQFGSVEAEISRLYTEQQALQQDVDQTQNRIFAIQSRLKDLTVEISAATAIGLLSRLGAPGIFGLESEKSDLELELQNISAQLPNLKSNLRRISNHIDERQAHATRLSDRFRDLNCPLGLKVFG